MGLTALRLELVIGAEYGLLKAECLSLPHTLPPPTLPPSPLLSLSPPPGVSPGVLLVGGELKLCLLLSPRHPHHPCRLHLEDHPAQALPLAPTGASFSPWQTPRGVC